MIQSKYFNVFNMEIATGSSGRIIGTLPSVSRYVMICLSLSGASEYKSMTYMIWRQIWRQIFKCFCCHHELTHQTFSVWVWVKTQSSPFVKPKISGKWMFIPKEFCGLRWVWKSCPRWKPFVNIPSSVGLKLPSFWWCRISQPSTVGFFHTSPYRMVS